jgi:hypothetical protein
MGKGQSFFEKKSQKHVISHPRFDMRWEPPENKTWEGFRPFESRRNTGHRQGLLSFERTEKKT